MNKMRILRTVNLLLLFSITAQAITGLIFFFGIVVPGMPAVALIHRFNAPLLVVLAGLHLALNWTWVKMNYFRKSPAR